MKQHLQKNSYTIKYSYFLLEVYVRGTFVAFVVFNMCRTICITYSKVSKINKESSSKVVVMERNWVYHLYTWAKNFTSVIKNHLGADIIKEHEEKLGLPFFSVEK